MPINLNGETQNVVSKCFHIIPEFWFSDRGMPKELIFLFSIYSGNKMQILFVCGSDANLKKFQQIDSLFKYDFYQDTTMHPKWWKLSYVAPLPILFKRAELFLWNLKEI